MNKPLIGFVCLLCLILTSCKSQTKREQLIETSKKVVEAIKSNNSSDLRSLIGVSSLKVLGKDDEFLKDDVKQLNSLFFQYLKGKDIKYEITGMLNRQSQMAVQIPIFERVIDSAGVKEMHLNILFGPPNFVPLTKISGYELIRNKSDSTEFRKQ